MFDDYVLTQFYAIQTTMNKTPTSCSFCHREKVLKLLVVWTKLLQREKNVRTFRVVLNSSLRLGLFDIVSICQRLWGVQSNDIPSLKLCYRLGKVIKCLGYGGRFFALCTQKYIKSSKVDSCIWIARRLYI